MRPLCLAPGLAATIVAAAAAQQPAAPAAPAGPPPLEVGTVAPDFTLPGATRFGALRAPIRLSDFKGKTVVLAFFFKARTRG
jgi:thioredoxin-dependent peroxiredoxin